MTTYASGVVLDRQIYNLARHGLDLAFFDLTPDVLPYVSHRPRLLLAVDLERPVGVVLNVAIILGPELEPGFQRGRLHVRTRQAKDAHPLGHARPYGAGYLEIAQHHTVQNSVRLDVMHLDAFGGEKSLQSADLVDDVGRVLFGCELHLPPTESLDIW